MSEIDDIKFKINKFKQDNEKSISQNYVTIKGMEDMLKQPEYQKEKVVQDVFLVLRMTLWEQSQREFADNLILEIVLDFLEYNLNRIDNLNDSIIKSNIKNETNLSKFQNAQKEIKSDMKVIKELKKILKARKKRIEESNKLLEGSPLYA